MPDTPKSIRLIRAYDIDESTSGYRVLVDRLWPRGVGKEKLGLDQWAKELAPSTSLRKWFGHAPQRWEEFQRRYKAELAERKAEMRALIEEAGNERTILLIYAAKDQDHNHAIVLRRALEAILA